MAPAVPTITLNNGLPVPQLGFGVWQVPDDEADKAVTTALGAGYRLIDTAAVYGNEEGVGRALASSDVPREEVFLTTKLWNTEQGYDSTLRAFDASLQRLGLDYVDLYLIHWPLPQKDAYVETWRAFERLYAEGRAKAIGVSNFQPHHLDRLAAETEVVPAVNQVELHPYLQQRELRAACDRRQTVLEAWSPLASGGDVLRDPVIAAIAEAHGRSPAQVVLRWHVEQGHLVIPKSVTPERIAANIDVFDFELTQDELGQIGGLDRDGRVGPHPDEFNLGA
ncbi:diketogulonate reductase-like aldo/keto reductase [Kineococcus xinjiangensis]|uniref:Diketogulonate reductase-like aldo/keto reductase n=1 Tax=Kineococcus xinjiangensis TaxID=512762 RepID=A0A2S6IMH0_9ACTN|nr:aldo/keto reductase [Kineococcus xinjiangensis]PPK95408.1 diketogulonate reductase-like aldo/keto reductase [Kineococcus xinjiangensis]